MNIIEESKNLTTAERYKLTMAPDIGRMSEHKGETLNVKAFAVFEDEDSEGVTKEIVSIMDDSGRVLATNSKTFLNDFKRIINMFEAAEEPVPPLKIVSGNSKAGREFISCTIA